ncbi:UNVERIFIED_CONTAM: hypothetical protein FKN15_063904 [Acipenser sinensis]
MDIHVWYNVFFFQDCTFETCIENGSKRQNLERFQLEVEDKCPLCATKGRTQALQVYRINLQESIALCGNPQCIFPLGCKPLADVLISGTSKGKLSQSKAKRKHICTSPGNTQIDLPSKHRRRAEEINTEEKLESVFETPVNGLACEPGAVNLGNSQLSGPCLSKENLHEVNGAVDSLQTNEDVAQKHTLNTYVLGKEEPPPVQGDLEELNEINPEEWVPVPRCLYWKNKHALCWLDCIMVALVQSRAVKECVINLNTESAIKRLCTVYEKACTLLTEQGKENEGEQESPVFALPLFLKLDPQTEELFKHTYCWEFECAVCGYTSQDRTPSSITSSASGHSERTGKTENCVRACETAGLRYKLLKKLKAKKEKLASLNRLLITPQTLPNGKAGPFRTASDSTARFDKSSKMQRLDSTDTESMYTASASTSLCSSPCYDEFFADLLSPATTTGTASPDDADAVMLEALASGKNNGGLTDGTSMDHNCYNFTPVMQPQAYTHETPKLTRCTEESFFSPAKEDLFTELLSTSTLQSYGVESEDLHHFDENFF